MAFMDDTYKHDTPERILLDFKKFDYFWLSSSFTYNVSARLIDRELRWYASNANNPFYQRPLYNIKRQMKVHLP